MQNPSSVTLGEEIHKEEAKLLYTLYKFSQFYALLTAVFNLTPHYGFLMLLSEETEQVATF